MTTEQGESSRHPDTFTLWGLPLPRTALGKADVAYLSELPPELPTIEWLWAEMDRVWRSMGLDNERPLEQQPVGTFYAHPVWIANGVFGAVDPTSTGHRDAIADAVASTEPRHVAEWGGGLGELALRLHDRAPASTVTIVEPFAGPLLAHRVAPRDGVHIAADIPVESQDVVIAQDVLEHVEDPIGLAMRLVQTTRPGGRLFFANAFLPQIDCHLPSTFHLHRTFRYVMQAYGLRFVGVVSGAEHAQVYERSASLRPRLARSVERLSRVADVAGVGRWARRAAVR